MPKGYTIPWAPEEEKFVKENYCRMTLKEMLVELQKITPARTLNSLKRYVQFHGIKSGRTGQFEKGHVPQNKGQSMSPEVYAKLKPTMFKKGNRVANQKPVGTRVKLLRYNLNGKKHKKTYWQTKIAEPNVWKMDHLILWEKYYGPVPKGHKVIFVDGNTDNITIENLRLISNATKMKMNNPRIPVNQNITTVEQKQIAIDILEIDSMLKESKQND